MIKKITTKIIAVSYLNTLPFIYGLENYKSEYFDFVIDLQIPSICSQKLLNNEAEIGLIPVASLLNLNHYQIISDFCIGAITKVKSVLLLSDSPLDQIDKIYLDYQSSTSVKLVQVLAKIFWKISPEFIPSYPGFESDIKENVAGVVIGDRTFDLPKKYRHTYDLAEQWNLFTGLPFVFACWITTKDLSEVFKDEFNKALDFGIRRIDQVVEENHSKNLFSVDLKDYYENCISYQFDDKKMEGLTKFLSLCP